MKQSGTQENDRQNSRLQVLGFVFITVLQLVVDGYGPAAACYAMVPPPPPPSIATPSPHTPSIVLCWSTYK
jgi:hypothetical protein